MSSDGEEDYKVGPGKPPLSGRFPKGKSGNPRGRPKRSTSEISIWATVLEEKVTIMEGGKQRVVTKQEAFIRSQVNLAYKGNRQAVLTTNAKIQQIEGIKLDFEARSSARAVKELLAPMTMDQMLELRDRAHEKSRREDAYKADVALTNPLTGKKPS